MVWRVFDILTRDFLLFTIFLHREYTISAVRTYYVRIEKVPCPLLEGAMFSLRRSYVRRQKVLCSQREHTISAFTKMEMLAGFLISFSHNSM
jgi:hypothetical protein